MGWSRTKPPKMGLLFSVVFMQHSRFIFKTWNILGVSCNYMGEGFLIGLELLKWHNKCLLLEQARHPASLLVLVSRETFLWWEGPLIVMRV